METNQTIPKWPRNDKDLDSNSHYGHKEKYVPNDIIKKGKRKSTQLELIFSNHAFSAELVLRIYSSTIHHS